MSLRYESQCIWGPANALGLVLLPELSDGSTTHQSGAARLSLLAADSEGAARC